MQTVLRFFSSVTRYHYALLHDLTQAVTGMHDFLAKPQDYYENIKIVEKEYRETTDVRKQFTIT